MSKKNQVPNRPYTQKFKAEAVRLAKAVGQRTGTIRTGHRRVASLMERGRGRVCARKRIIDLRENGIYELSPRAVRLGHSMAGHQFARVLARLVYWFEYEQPQAEIKPIEPRDLTACLPRRSEVPPTTFAKWYALLPLYDIRLAEALSTKTTGRWAVRSIGPTEFRVNNHPIADRRHWVEYLRLDLRPSYQAGSSALELRTKSLIDLLKLEAAFRDGAAGANSSATAWHREPEAEAGARNARQAIRHWQLRVSPILLECASRRFDRNGMLEQLKEYKAALGTKGDNWLTADFRAYHEVQFALYEARAYYIANGRNQRNLDLAQRALNRVWNKPAPEFGLQARAHFMQGLIFKCAAYERYSRMTSIGDPMPLGQLQAEATKIKRDLKEASSAFEWALEIAMMLRDWRLIQDSCAESGTCLAHWMIAERRTNGHAIQVATLQKRAGERLGMALHIGASLLEGRDNVFNEIYALNLLRGAAIADTQAFAILAPFAGDERMKAARQTGVLDWIEQTWLHTRRRYSDLHKADFLYEAALYCAAIGKAAYSDRYRKALLELGKNASDATTVGIEKNIRTLKARLLELEQCKSVRG